MLPCCVRGMLWNAHRQYRHNTIVAWSIIRLSIHPNDIVLSYWNLGCIVNQSVICRHACRCSYCEIATRGMSIVYYSVMRSSSSHFEVVAISMCGFIDSPVTPLFHTSRHTCLAMMVPSFAIGCYILSITWPTYTDVQICFLLNYLKDCPL